MPKINYTEPQLSPCNPKPSDISKSWFVWFRYFHNGEWRLFRLKKDINRQSNFRERLKDAKALVDYTRYKLEQQGWNPVTNTTTVKQLELDLKKLGSFTFDEALTFAYEKKSTTLKHKSKQDYSSKIKFLKEAAHAVNILHAKINTLRRPHYKQLLETTQQMRMLSNTGYNNYRTILSALLHELIQWDVVEANYIADISTKKEIKELCHRPPTQDERLAIIAHIKEHHPNYYRFLSIIYGCAIRPKEITQMKIKHLHKLEGVFRLTPDITKNGQAREVAIPNWVMDLLSEMNLHNHAPEDYLFSGKGQMFLPGKNKMHVNSTTRLWFKVVKEKLGIEVNQYALKKLSGDDMVRLQRREGTGNLLELARAQMGHASQNQTSVYTTEDKVVMNEVIKKYMPQL